MIICTFTMETTPEKREPFRAMLLSMMHSTEVEPGCILYRYTADLENPDRFHLIELWESETAMEGHLDAAHSKDFIKRLPDLGRIVAAKAYTGDVGKFKIRPPKVD